MEEIPGLAQRLYSRTKASTRESGFDGEVLPPTRKIVQSSQHNPAGFDLAYVLRDRNVVRVYESGNATGSGQQLWCGGGFSGAVRPGDDE